MCFLSMLFTEDGCIAISVLGREKLQSNNRLPGYERVVANHEMFHGIDRLSLPWLPPCV